ncbi:MAG: hypothetical protein ABIR55_01320 [Burkholderiaceae bacterium]
MQAIYLITRAASGLVASWRRRRLQRLAATLSHELAHAEPRIKAEIAVLIRQATSPASALPCAGHASKTAWPAPTAARSAAASNRGNSGFRTSPLPGLPTHMQYFNT